MQLHIGPSTLAHGAPCIRLRPAPSNKTQEERFQPRSKMKGLNMVRWTISRFDRLDNSLHKLD